MWGNNKWDTTAKWDYLELPSSKMDVIYFFYVMQKTLLNPFDLINCSRFVVKQRLPKKPESC